MNNHQTEALRLALDNFRDTILNQRGALAENGMTNEQVNDVLNEFDDADFYGLLAAPVEQAPEPISEQNARFAIDGAIAYGSMGINKPPSADHWLMSYWQIGQQLAAAPSHEIAQERYFPFEFEVWQGDEMCASASGPREYAMREAMHYVTQYEQDGPVRVFEVTRTLVAQAKETALPLPTDQDKERERRLFEWARGYAVERRAKCFTHGGVLYETDTGEMIVEPAQELPCMDCGSTTEGVHALTCPEAAAQDHIGDELFQISDCSDESVNAVLEVPQPTIAISAKQTANDFCIVVMVNMEMRKASTRVFGLADEAAIALLEKHLFVLTGAEIVFSAQSPGSSSTGLPEPLLSVLNSCGVELVPSGCRFGSTFIASNGELCLTMLFNGKACNWKALSALGAGSNFHVKNFSTSNDFWQHPKTEMIGEPSQEAQEPGGITSKQAWWNGYRAGKGLPQDTPRQEALAITAVSAVPVQPTGTKERYFLEDSRNWEEDFVHENGNYENQCVSCNQIFIGHKRRGICKSCAALQSAEKQQSGNDHVAVNLAEPESRVEALQPPCTNEFVAHGCEPFREPKASYEELEAMYFAQCNATDEFAERAAEHGDAALLARIAELETDLAKVNQRLSEAQSSMDQPTEGKT